MAEQNLTFYTVDPVDTTKTLRQKVYLFSSTEPNFHRRCRNTETPTSVAPLYQGEDKKKVHTALKPKLPSKKLFEEPRFFLSLERRKIRIIDGLKNFSMIERQCSATHHLKGKKLKQGGSPVNLRKVNSTIDSSALQSARTGWEPSNRIPYLNFNMQYLIRKRRSMTPGLLSAAEKTAAILSARHH